MLTGGLVVWLTGRRGNTTPSRCAIRRYVADREEPPREMLRRRWVQLRSAGVAGAGAWQQFSRDSGPTSARSTRQQGSADAVAVAPSLNNGVAMLPRHHQPRRRSSTDAIVNGYRLLSVSGRAGRPMSFSPCHSPVGPPVAVKILRPGGAITSCQREFLIASAVDGRVHRRTDRIRRRGRGPVSGHRLSAGLSMWGGNHRLDHADRGAARVRWCPGRRARVDA